jgi:hypothetical protein
MAKDVTCDIDRFAATLESLIGDIPARATDGVEKAVRKQASETAKKLRGEFTENIGLHDWSEEYREGFTSRTDRKKLEVSAEIGNKAKPGLVHLLEEGHATLTGRRTRKYPHMEPAFIDMQEGFEEKAKRHIIEELRS